MAQLNRKRKILVAEDDDDDYMLIVDAMGEAGLAHEIIRVSDGEYLVETLLAMMKKGRYELPDMILLDLNMPRKSGREALKEIKTNSDLCKTPIVVFTTSGAQEDIEFSYQLGVNSFTQKPLRFQEMVDFFKVMEEYWFKMSKLPNQRNVTRHT